MYEIFEKLCNIKGITPYKFGKDMSVSSSTISTWKKKNSLAGPELSEKVCEYFGVTIDFLMGKTDKIECKECGQTYNPFDEFDADIHNTYHQKILQAMSMYPSLTPYAVAVQIKAHGLSEIEHYDITDDKIIDILSEYLKAAFSLYVYKDFEPEKRYDYADFCKSEITRLIKEDSIPNKSVDYVLDVYGIDKGFLIETDTLLARASKVDTLMRLLAYAEKLSPQMQKVLELQAKVLSEQNPDE